MKILQEMSPILFDLISNSLPLKKVTIDLIALLIEKSLKPFQDKTAHTDKPVLVCSDLHCFPSLPEKRSRGSFTADKNNIKNERCKKTFRGHPSLLPGIFTLFCQHGVCYGFQIMSNHESPNIPFTILRTRFETAPKIVIYDFACSLHKYCLRRDPTNKVLCG